MNNKILRVKMQMPYNKIVTVLLILLNQITFAQLSVKSTFGFLEAPQNSTIAALGGQNVSLYKNDASFLITNPALMDSNMADKLSLNYVNYFSGVNAGAASYVYKLKKIGNIGFSAQYLNYGKIDETDNAGNIIGSISANEVAFYTHYGVKKDNFKFGANAKLAGSFLGYQNSMAILFDLAASTTSKNQNIRYSLVISNIGTAFKYYGSKTPIMPTDIHLGLTIKPDHMPLRFSFTTQNMVFRDGFDQKSALQIVADKVIIATELLIGKNLSFQMGYNYGLRKRLLSPGRPGLTGFSMGGLLETKRFSFGYGKRFLDRDGGQNYISLNFKI